MEWVKALTTSSIRTCVIESVRYDGTPMKAKTRDNAASVHAQSAHEDGILALVAPIFNASSLRTWVPELGVRTDTNSAASKIVQTGSVFGCLLDVGGKFVLIASSVIVCHLQVLERCTAQCMHQALMQHSVANQVANTFEDKVRTAATDQNSANIVCEKSILCENELRGWLGIHNFCDVHTTARVFKRVFGLVQDDIRGLVRHSLSLGIAAEMNKFRRALRAEIRHRGVRVLRGQAPLDAQRHRQFMMHLFVSRGKNLVPKRALLSLLPNGDWRSYELQMYIGDASEISKERAEAIFCNGLVTALAGCMFATYPQHRWLGCDISVDQCGVLEMVHGLGSSSYLRYMNMFHGGKIDLQLAAPEYGTPSLPALMCEADAGEDSDAEDSDEAGRVGDKAAEPDAQTDLAKTNSKSRKIATAWWRSKPLGSLIIIRMVMEPLREMLGKQMWTAGEQWSRAELCSAAMAKL